MHGSAAARCIEKYSTDFRRADLSACIACMQPCLSGIVVAGNEEIFEIIFFLRFCKKKNKIYQK
jgi:hypothetical protein